MPTYDDINKEFEPQRQKAQKAISANTQQRRDAIARRSAQLGGAPGGFAIKQEQEALREGSEQMGEVNEGIDAAVRGEQRRIKEIDEGRAFQRGEREAGQAYASGEAVLGRKFSSGEREAGQLFSRGEREGSQAFASGEAELGRRFSTGEREAMQRYGTGEREASQLFAGSQADIDRKAAREALQSGQEFAREGMKQQRELQQSAQEFSANENLLGRRLQERGIDLNEEIFKYQREVEDPWNMDMAEKAAKKKDPLEQLFSYPSASGSKGKRAAQVGTVLTGLPVASVGRAVTRWRG